MEAMLEWARKFSEHVSDQWKTVVYLIGKFHRSKSIKKDQGGRKNTAITVQDNKVYLFDSYVEHLVQKTPKLHLDKLICFLRAFLAASREETNDTGTSFCL